MVEKEEKVIKTFKKPLIFVSIIAIVIIGIMGLILNMQSNQIENYRENYQWKCEAGTYNICITNGLTYVEFNRDAGEYPLIIKEDEVAIKCDTDRKEKAICINENEYWNPCGDDEYQICMDYDEDYVTCGFGYDALCVKEDKKGTLYNGYISYCDIGEDATCVDWDKYYLALN